MVSITLMILFPYSIVLLISSLLQPTLMEVFFHNNILIGLFFICILGLVSFGSAIFISIKNFQNSPLKAAKQNIIIKLFQVPAYLFIFVVGLACMVTIFSMGISFFLIAFDGISIFLSGLVGISAVKCNYTNGILSKKELLFYGVLQFIFCVDVICAIFLWKKAVNSFSNKEKKEG